jgi:hypothetical protein
MIRVASSRGAAPLAFCAAALCAVVTCVAQGDPPARDKALPQPGQVEPAPRPEAPSALDGRKLVNRLDEIGPLLSKCLQLPEDSAARPGMRVTLRLAFTRDGAILGEPRFTFTTPAPPDVKAAYQRAAVDMLNRCTPLPITKELGGAIAGRPFVIPIVDTRYDKKADNADDLKA